MYDDVHIWNVMLHYDNEEFFDTQPLSDVMNDECMEAYACMLPRVIWEGYVGLYDLRWKV